MRGLSEPVMGKGFSKQREPRETPEVRKCVGETVPNPAGPEPGFVREVPGLNCSSPILTNALSLSLHTSQHFC